MSEEDIKNTKTESNQPEEQSPEAVETAIKEETVTAAKEAETAGETAVEAKSEETTATEEAEEASAEAAPAAVKTAAKPKKAAKPSSKAKKPASEVYGHGAGRNLRKTRVGVVTSNKMEKTIVVDVVRRVPHPKFGKIIKRTTRLYAHDEAGEAAIGDKVRVMETRPMSKLKRWRLIEVLAH